ncbi:hydrolase, had superfamily [hydrocarbon metagenome]|uniref:Hydrolase, had superfamily n=1 Tax=hydrocarbon metagenome TaxID=938273 RepID=A0A0W8FG79_9ZZZZ|nr:HAD family hydrolase [Methanomicrobiaceae archaeon]
MQTADGAWNREIKAILFDMDNTLFDFVTAKREACRLVIDHLRAGDAGELFEYFLRGVHGFEHHDNIRDYMKKTGSFSPRAFLECCSVYEDEKLRRIEVYPGVAETLSCLKDAGIGLAVTTDAELRQADKRLNKTGLITFFDCVVTPDVSGRRKPEPDSLLYALNRLQVSPKEAMMVGDSPVRDIAPGKRLGMATAFAAYGDWRRSCAEPAGADIVLQAFPELLGHLGLSAGRDLSRRADLFGRATRERDQSPRSSAPRR